MASWPLLIGGVFFFFAGTVGLLRFPDIYSRLHAVTKADTLGLGLIVFGLSLRADSWQAVFVMILVWLLVMASSTTACQLLAHHAREQDGAEQENIVRAPASAEADLDRH